MRYRTTFLVGAAVGYVFGARAGRERYEQIKRMYRQIAQNPTVQETAGVIRAQAGEMVENARDTLAEKLPERMRRGPVAREAPAPRTRQSASTH